jgi:ethanolamine ammonia-lyase large subunit
VNFIMGVPGADDLTLKYQSTSFHDALYVREVLGLRRAPEFELWLQQMGIVDQAGLLKSSNSAARALLERGSRLTHHYVSGM